MNDETSGEKNGNGNAHVKPESSAATSSSRAARERPRARREGPRIASRSARDAIAPTPDEDDRDLSTAEEGLMALREAVETQLRERPYVTLACAVGAGMLLSQALTTRVGRVALLAAGGYAATRFLRSDGMGLLSRALGGDIDDEDPDELPATGDLPG